MTHSDWIERVIEEYEERAQAVVAAEAAAELETAESLEDADTKQDIEEIFVDAGVDMGRCCSGTCRKKYPSTCSRRFLFVSILS